MAAVPDNLLSWRGHQLRPYALRAFQATRADGVAIALDAGDDVICEASVGAAPEVGSKVERGSTWSSRCMREAVPVSFSHTGANGHASYSAILAPIFQKGNVIGFCGAFAARPYAFTPSQLRRLVEIAKAAAECLSPKQEPASPKPVLVEKREAAGVPSEILKEVEAEIADFAVIEKRRARLRLAGKSVCAAMLAIMMTGSFFPDRVQAWAQPILYKIGDMLRQSSPASTRQKLGVPPAMQTARK